MPETSQTKSNKDITNSQGGFVKNQTGLKSEVSEDPVNLAWVGPEFVSYEKNKLWFVYVTLVCFLLSVLIYIFFRDVITIIVVLVLGSVFALYGARKPEDIHYAVTNTGFSIGAKNYLYSEFRMFNILEEGEFISVEFIPLKRFSVSAGIYFKKDMQDKILSVLNNKLPYEHQAPNFIDNFAKRIKF
ncbi:MAG TPA: hypothetical protein VL989_00045 [Candidatus Sulfotelmatobacter sp.]|nr:hypothetical protein [Candidatus Sulfotelmatobacter sp.]